MAFVDELKQHAEKVRKNLPNVKGEEATKTALILPFLQVLGYDVYDPTILKPEFTADVAKKKANGQSWKVDYALHAEGQPVIIIECKTHDTLPDLSGSDGQLAYYFPWVLSARVGILTNGIKYRFFTDLTNTNVMDSIPFFEFNALEFTDRDVEALSHYTAASFRADQVKTHAAELSGVAKISSLISALMREPSGSFVKFLLGEVEVVEGHVTAKVVERYVPIVRTAFTEAVKQLAAQGVSQVMTHIATAPALAVHAAPIAGENPSEGNLDSGATATAEELDLLERVKKIVAGSPTKVPITGSHKKSYFAVNLGRVGLWFLRFYGKGSKKFVVLRMPHASLQPLLGQTAAFQLDDDETRVDLASVADVDRLAAEVRAAYEKQALQAD